MKQYKFLIPMLFSIVVLIGCADQKILERIALVTLLGYDLGDEDKITATSVIRQVNPEFQSTVETHSDTEATSKGTRQQINLETSKKVMAGQMRVVLFGEDFSEKGLHETLHTLIMNSEVSNSIYLAVVEGRAQPLIETKYPNITDVGQHIFGLIDHNIKQQHVISSTLHEVVRDFYNPLRDLTLPILKQEGKQIVISGTAFFHKGKMQGKLPSKDTLYLMMARGKFRFGTLQLELPSDGLSSKDNMDTVPIALDSINSVREIKLVDPKIPEYDLNIVIQCRILEIHSTVSTGDPKAITKIEKAISKKLEGEVERIIKASIEMDANVFGFGEKYKTGTRNSNLTEDEWHEKYHNLKVNVNVKTSIIRNGVFE